MAIVGFVGECKVTKFRGQEIVPGCSVGDKYLAILVHKTVLVFDSNGIPNTILNVKLGEVGDIFYVLETIDDINSMTDFKIECLARKITEDNKSERDNVIEFKEKFEKLLGEYSNKIKNEKFSKITETYMNTIQYTFINKE